MLSGWGARLCRVAASLAVSTLVSSCIAVGTDYLHPAAPNTDRYTREPPPASTGSTGVAGSGAQHFAYGRDLPEHWWRLFRSHGLNKLVEQALRANPNLQA